MFFLAAVLGGILAALIAAFTLVSIGIRREDRGVSILDGPPGLMAAAARHATGLRVYGLATCGPRCPCRTADATQTFAAPRDHHGHDHRGTRQS
jgi:hypothetical protein